MIICRRNQKRPSMESAANFAPLRPADFANLPIVTFNLEKMTPGDFFYTGTACGACDKYQLCSHIPIYENRDCVIFRKLAFLHFTGLGIWPPLFSHIQVRRYFYRVAAKWHFRESKVRDLTRGGEWYLREDPLANISEASSPVKCQHWQSKKDWK